VSLRGLDAELDELRERGLLREPPTDATRPVVPPGKRFCSNDYLGYAAEPLTVSSTASGAGASRLVWGDTAAHAAAERALADLVGLEAALVCSSGYAANVGLLAAIAGRDDLVVSDRLNHASIIDGCRLSGATIAVVPHLDVGAVREALATGKKHRRKIVVTETYFSMDGDVADLRGLRDACDEHDAALVVDEAHAIGVFGAEGAGQARAQGVVVDGLVGTLGKSFGLQGSFVAGSEALRRWLWNRSRSFVFSTGVMPALAELVVDRVQRLRADDAGRARLFSRARELRELVKGLGGQAGPIAPLVVGEPGRTTELAGKLLESGFLVQAIRPPTVPVGTSRLRLTVTAKHEAAEVAAFARALASVV